MTDQSVFEPLYADQDENTILARWRDWANEGLDPVDDAANWTDTREGSHWFADTTPPRREAALIYDLMGSEVPASSYPQFAWGEWLDSQAQLRQLSRLAATFAEGTVTFSGTNGTVISPGTVVAVEPATPGADSPEFETNDTGTISGGEIDVTVVATVAGEAGNVAALAINSIVTPVGGLASVSNAAETIGGTNVESDTALRVRVLEAYTGSAVANILYYKRLGLDQAGVGRVTVIPAWDGPGTILIILATADGSPVAGSVVTDFQALVDPVPGQGAGSGQAGATITVDTAITLDVAVTASIEFADGYSEDGAGNTIPLGDVIETVVTAYIESVESGDEVVYEKAKAVVAVLAGVHDITDFKLNGATINIPVPVTPTPKVPSVTSVTVTSV